MENKYNILNAKGIYAIPVGEYFNNQSNACFLVYSPLANLFFLSLPNEVDELQDALINRTEHPVLHKLLSDQPESLFNVSSTN